MAITVNGRRIDDEAIRAEAERMRPEFERAFADEPPSAREPRLQEWARENAVEHALLEEAARADPEPVPADALEPAMEAARRQVSPAEMADDALRADVELHLRLRRLMENVGRDAPPPSDDEVRRWYEEHLAEFAAPERVRAAHIVKSVSAAVPPEIAEAALLEVKKELQGGAAFAALAARHSDCPENGGDLGWFPRGRMVEEFEHVVWKMRVGETSPVFATRFGFHIVRLLDRKPAGPYALEEVEGHIRERLAAEHRSAALEKFIDDLRAKATIEEA